MSTASTTNNWSADAQKRMQSSQKKHNKKKSGKGPAAYENHALTFAEEMVKKLKEQLHQAKLDVDKRVEKVKEEHSAAASKMQSEREADAQEIARLKMVIDALHETNSQMETALVIQTEQTQTLQSTVEKLQAQIETTIPVWKESKECTGCSCHFSFSTRQHHCRKCGLAFCDDCSSKRLPLMGRSGKVRSKRVCNSCCNNATGSDICG
eukprot:GILK01004217.1.p1 GENE.GILK01004217.1~~GILK01004217.1.p1  ORF type:complete len:224 (-),score=45.02 GILK01004217.1:225-851(-)